MAEPSAAFRSFLDSLASTGRDWGDELDVASLRTLTGDERGQAEAILLDRLANSTDVRVPPALIAVCAATVAVPALTAALPRAKGDLRVAIAEAMRTLVADETRTVLLDVLRGRDEAGKPLAAIVIRNYRGSRVDDTLLEAISDGSAPLRVHAVDSLFAIYNLNRFYPPGRWGGLAVLFLQLKSSWPSLRKPAVAKLRELVEKLSSGATASELGWPLTLPPASAEFQRFWDSLDAQGTSDYDLDALLHLSGDERETAEAELLLGRLSLESGRGGDPRAPRALAAIKSKRAVEPLQLTLPQAHGLFAVEVATALRAIAKDKSGFGAIAAALRNGAVEERRRAIEVLAAYPSADAKSALTAAASQDPDPAVQKYAQEALAKLPS
jgi:hypothetical protein